jgi:hypothetical protein
VAVLLGLVRVGAAQNGNLRAQTVAEGSRFVERAMAQLEREAGMIHDRRLRAQVLDLLANPAPTFMSRYAEPGPRGDVERELHRLNLLDPGGGAPLFPPLTIPERSPQPFSSAPGGPEGGHHSYPGGLAVHTAFNVQQALALMKLYRGDAKVSAIDRDVVVAAAIWHDAMKPWVLQWRADGTLSPERTIAGTGAHHIFGLAEAMFRHVRPDVIAAIAAAHAPLAGDSAAAMEGYLRSAALLAGFDAAGPQGAGLAHPSSVAFEPFINYLADHDFVLTERIETPVIQELGGFLRAQALERFGLTADPTAVRWTVLRIRSELGTLRIYSVWHQEGERGLKKLLASYPSSLIPQEIVGGSVSSTSTRAGQ